MSIIKRMFFITVFFLMITSFRAYAVELNPVAVITGDEMMGRMKEPAGLFFDEGKKRLYIADSENNRLISLDSEYQYLSELSHENFSMPLGVAKRESGEFFLIDGAKRELKSVNLKEKIVGALALKDIPPAREKFMPSRFVMDNQERLYLIDNLNRRIIVVDSSGAFIRAIVVDDKNLSGFNDLKVDEADIVYAVDSVSAMVYVFDDKGKPILKFGGRKNGHLKFPVGLAVDKRGFIYVLDRHEGNIAIFDKKGEFQYQLAREGEREGELYNPSYIMIDKSGRIYTIDGNRVQVFEERE